MSGGYQTDSEAFDAFGRHLDELADELRKMGELIQSCVADPGIFGLVGQVFGAGASAHCGKAGTQVTDYAEVIEKFKDKLDKAKDVYAEQEEEVKETLSRYQV